jgi:hypothetical protein
MLLRLKSLHSALKVYLPARHDSPRQQRLTNLLHAELNPIRHLLALLGAHHLGYVSRVRVKSVHTSNRLVCTADTKFDLCEVHTKLLYEIQTPVISVPVCPVPLPVQ